MIVCLLAEFKITFLIFSDRTNLVDSHTSPEQRAARHTCLIFRAFTKSSKSERSEKSVVLFDNSCLFYVQLFLCIVMQIIVLTLRWVLASSIRNILQNWLVRISPYQSDYRSGLA